MWFFLSSQKITISKQCKQRKKVFSLKNAGWIVSEILDKLFNVDQINQWYFSNEAHRKTSAQSSTIIY